MAIRTGSRPTGSTSTTRILAVCDVYDALVSDRVYREAWSHERAVGLLRDAAQFDQRCVDALERVVARERGAGSAGSAVLGGAARVPRPGRALGRSAPAPGQTVSG